jgi:hypothetical protein
MKAKIILCLALVLSSLIFVQHAFGLMSEVQLKQSDANNSQCSVKVESTADGIHFSCQIHKGQYEENDLFYATLRIYEQTNLVAICPVEKTSDAQSVRCEFTVGKGYLDNSRFYLTEMFRDKDGNQIASGTQYWFYLCDFADVKQSAKP